MTYDEVPPFPLPFYVFPIERFEHWVATQRDRVWSVAEAERESGVLVRQDRLARMLGRRDVEHVDGPPAHGDYAPIAGRYRGTPGILSAVQIAVDADKKIRDHVGKVRGREAEMDEVAMDLFSPMDGAARFNAWAAKAAKQGPDEPAVPAVPAATPETPLHSPTPWKVCMSAELEGGFTTTAIKDADGICVLTANDVVKIGSPPDADAVLAVEAVNRMEAQDEAARIQTVADAARPLPRGAGYAALDRARAVLVGDPTCSAQDVLRRALDEVAVLPHDEECNTQMAGCEGRGCSCHVGIAERALRAWAVDLVPSGSARQCPTCVHVISPGCKAGSKDGSPREILRTGLDCPQWRPKEAASEKPAAAQGWFVLCPNCGETGGGSAGEDTSFCIFCGVRLKRPDNPKDRPPCDDTECLHAFRDGRPSGFCWLSVGPPRRKFSHGGFVCEDRDVHTPRPESSIAKERSAEKPVEHVAVVRPGEPGTVRFVPPLTDARGNVLDRLDFEHGPDGVLRLTVMARRRVGPGPTLGIDHALADRYRKARVACYAMLGPHGDARGFSSAEVDRVLRERNESCAELANAVIAALDEGGKGR